MVLTLLNFRIKAVVAGWSILRQDDGKDRFFVSNYFGVTAVRPYYGDKIGMLIYMM